MKIQKQENSNIVFMGLTGKRSRKQFNPNTASIEYIGGENQEFAVYDSGNLALSFQFSQVEFTEIAPDDPVAVGTIAAFITLMEESFFFKPVATEDTGILPLRAEIQTVDVTNTVVYSVSLPSSSITTYSIFAHALGEAATATADKACAFYRTVSVFVDSSGIHAFLGSPTNAVSKNGTAPANFSPVPNFTTLIVGNKLEFYVNSLAAQIVNWRIFFTQTTVQQ